MLEACLKCGGPAGHSSAACRVARYRRRQDPLIGSPQRKENQRRGLQYLREVQADADLADDLYAAKIMSIDAKAEAGESYPCVPDLAKMHHKSDDHILAEDFLQSGFASKKNTRDPKVNRHGYIGNTGLWKQLLQEATRGFPSRYDVRYRCAADSPHINGQRLHKRSYQQDPYQPPWEFDPAWRAWEQACHAVKHLEGLADEAPDPVVPIHERARFEAWKQGRESVTQQTSERTNKVISHVQDLSPQEREILRVSLAHHIADATELRERLADDDESRYGVNVIRFPKADSQTK